MTQNKAYVPYAFEARIDAMKLVSIILPCYNHEHYISDCMNSLCDQTYENIELLITDDCSRDDSFSVLQSWQSRLEQRFCRVVISRNPENQGVVRTLNGMLENCRGDYIKVLATDDMLLPEAIEKMVAFAQQTDSDVVFTNAYRFPEELHYPISDYAQLEKVYTAPPSWPENMTGALLERNFICAPAVLMPRRTIEKFGLYDPAYIMEDFEYWLRVSVGGKFAYLDSLTVLYRANRNSLSHFTLDPAQQRRHRTFFEQELDIFTKYEHHADKEQKTSFFNWELGITIGLGDKALAGEILANMRKRGLPVSLWNRLRHLLLKANVYILLKKCKHLLKGN